MSHWLARTLFWSTMIVLTVAVLVPLRAMLGDDLAQRALQESGEVIGLLPRR